MRETVGGLGLGRKRESARAGTGREGILALRGAAI